jgi:flagellar motor switch protein FliM
VSDPGLSPGIRGSEILGKRAFLDREFKVKFYDFKRPDKFSKEQIKTAAIIHETFARLASTALSARLSRDCSLELVCVDQMTFREFMDPLPDPTALGVFGLSPLKGAAVMHLEAPLYRFILDRLFGGPGSAAGGTGSAPSAVPGAAPSRSGAAPGDRGLTEVEGRVLGRALGQLTACLREAWSQVVALEPSAVEVETKPSFVQVVPPSDMILLASLKAELDGAAGLVTLVYPFLALEPVISKLSANYWYSKARRGAAGSLSPDEARLLPCEAEIVAEGEELALRDICALGPGSAVRVPDLDSARCVLRLGGREVLGLRLENAPGRGELRLSLRADARSGAMASRPPSIEGAARQADSAAFASSLAGLGDAIKAEFGSLREEIRELKTEQENMGDRLLFGQGGAAAGHGERVPFAALAQVPAETAAALLREESPQFLALVLSCLDDAAAMRIAERLTEESRAAAFSRLAAIGEVDAEALEAADGVLAAKVGAAREGKRVSGGLSKIVGILNIAPRAVECDVINRLEGLHPELAEEVKKNMFVFEDIVLLDAESLRLLAERADPGDMALAMKAVQAEIRERILAAFESGYSKALRASVEAQGRVRLSEADAAGQRVVALVRALDEEGLIVVERQAGD